MPGGPLKALLIMPPMPVVGKVEEPVKEGAEGVVTVVVVVMAGAVMVREVVVIAMAVMDQGGVVVGVVEARPGGQLKPPMIMPPRATPVGEVVVVTVLVMIEDGVTGSGVATGQVDGDWVVLVVVGADCERFAGALWLGSRLCDGVSMPMVAIGWNIRVVV